LEDIMLKKHWLTLGRSLAMMAVVYVPTFVLVSIVSISSSVDTVTSPAATGPLLIEQCSITAKRAGRDRASNHWANG